MSIRIGKILVDEKLITTDELNTALGEQQKTKEMLGEILIRLGFVTEKAMLRALGKQQGIPFVELSARVMYPFF